MTNAKSQMTNGIPKNHNAPKKVYDLAERTEIFGEDVIEFLKGIPQNSMTRPLIEQLVRSSTSVGANYCEADDALTKKEFAHRIGICRKESKESRFWLKMIMKVIPASEITVSVLRQEAKELNLIFSSISRKLKQ